MKMRRSLWRKLLVLLFVVLTIVSTFITVKEYRSSHEKTTSDIVLNGIPTVTTEETSDESLPYSCTVSIPLKNTSAFTKKPISVVVTIGGFGTLEIPFPVSSLASGETVDAVASFPISVQNPKISAISLIFTGKQDEVIFGARVNKSVPDYVKALIAITLILFGVFVYSCVALYKSPKKKVHHHHHHHHHSSDHSGSDKA